MAVFAHFTMDYPEFKPTVSIDPEQEQIGKLTNLVFLVRTKNFSNQMQ